MLKVWPLMCAALVCAAALAAEGRRQVVIYEGVATEVQPLAGESKDLWVTLPDLTRATKFVLKPQGVCRDELCFPIPKARRGEFLTQRGNVTWFNLSEFARLLRQPVAFDSQHAFWYFGPRPEDQNAYLASLVAPDFTLPDVQGKRHSLSDFRGRKVLLLTWASW